MDYHDELRNKAAELRQNVQEIGELAWKIARDKLEHARQPAADEPSVATLKDTPAQKGIKDKIRDKPLQSVFVAACAGILFGLLWRRR